MQKIYTLATWDCPPKKNDSSYTAYENAFRTLIQSRAVRVQLLSKQRAEEFDMRGGRKRWDPSIAGIPQDNEYDIGQAEHLKLIDFQVSGLSIFCMSLTLWIRLLV